ncbi:MAG: transcription termination/antitermination NusG family protein, partial [Chloroflexota bacterium]
MSDNNNPFLQGRNQNTETEEPVESEALAESGADEGQDYDPDPITIDDDDNFNIVLDDGFNDDLESDEVDKHWYVVHCYSGYENKVEHAIQQRIETIVMRDRIFDVLIPTEEETEVK